MSFVVKVRFRGCGLGLGIGMQVDDGADSADVFIYTCWD